MYAEEAPSSFLNKDCFLPVSCVFDSRGVKTTGDQITKQLNLKMSTKETNDFGVEKIGDNEKDGKCDIKGTKRPAEDKAEDVKKARKEENGAGSEGEDVEEEEEEGAEGEEEDDDEEIPEGDEEELEGEDEDDEDVEGEGEVDEEEDDA